MIIPSFQKIILIAISCALLCAKTTFAHQPQSMEATYNSKAKSLHIKIAHTSENRKQHYVRRIVVNLNDKDALSRNFFFQPTNTGLEIELPLEAQPKDQVIILVYSEKGGVLKQLFVISDITKSDDQNPAQTKNTEKKKQSY